MRRNRFIFVVVFGVAPFLTWLCISNLQADQGNANRPDPELAKAAESALKATMAEHAAGRATTEDYYQWSQRLMVAQKAEGEGAAAVTDHITRMQQLHNKVAALFKAKVKGGSEQEVHATKFYLLEAEALK